MSFTTDHVFFSYLAENLSFPSKFFRQDFKLIMEELKQMTNINKYRELLGKKKYSRIRRTTYPNPDPNLHLNLHLNTVR